MKHSQDRMQVQAALLRFDSGIDTPVKNSHCCAAAGITAFTCAHTGALIPHEKLRGAAPPEATLNAQSRPFAQPVVGYIHVSGYAEALPKSRAHDNHEQCRKQRQAEGCARRAMERQ